MSGVIMLFFRQKHLLIFWACKTKESSKHFNGVSLVMNIPVYLHDKEQFFEQFGFSKCFTAWSTTVLFFSYNV